MTLGASLTGCAERLPAYRWVNEARAMDLMAERAARIQTLSSPCRIILADPNAGTTQLEGAIAARMPGFLRLRAWKFSQPVLDLTLTPVGLWLYSAQDGDSPGERRSPFATLTAQQLRQAWSLTTGVIPRDGWTWDEPSSRTYIALRRDWESGGSIDCEIDRPTLTLRRCTVSQAPDAAVLTLALDRYQHVGELIVPTRVVLRSAHGTVTILLDDISLNDELPLLAFDPPQRAAKQP